MTKFLLGAALILASGAASAAEPDGLVLPQGFHAQVVAESVKGMRRMAVTPGGDLYVSTRDGLAAIKLDKDHKAGEPQFFTKEAGSGTGIRLYNGALYASSVAAVYRIKLDKNLVPSAAPEKILDGMPTTGFSNRAITFDNAGNLYVGVGGSGNTCFAPDTPKGQKPVGLNPCPGIQGRGGIWKFSAAKLNQKFPADGVLVATGLRDLDAMDWRPGSGLYAVMHDRNGTASQFPDLVSKDEGENISDEFDFISGKDVTHMGWPFTYWDGKRNIRLMAPEYGGNNKTQPPAGLYATPLAAFYPSHSPLDLVFYSGRQFPAKYRGGAFIVMHGGNGGHAAPGGYDVKFVPFANGKAGAPETFADGFAGADAASRNPDKAAYRPVGGAVGPDGALYLSDSKKGRIWRIFYDGK